MKNDYILDYINNNGGITLDKESKKAELKKGFMVSLYGSEYKTNDKKEVPKKINEYINNIQDKEGLFVGVWLDGGFYYVDYSINIIDEVEALEFGKKNKQISIYNIKDNSYLYIKDYSFSKYYTIYEVIKDKNENIIDYKIDTQKNNINELVNYFNLNIKTIKNSIYNELKGTYNQLINSKYIIIKDYELMN
ncbi:MAG: hypothetical protein ACI4OP_01735 [Candidatus Coprovivens sp.]